MKKHVDLSSEDSEQICKSILEDFINDIYNKDVVPIETYNHVSQQCQGWSSAYKNIETRNKQLEAQIAHERQRDLVLIKL